jgi:putative membrane protein
MTHPDGRFETRAHDEAGNLAERQDAADTAPASRRARAPGSPERRLHPSSVLFLLLGDLGRAILPLAAAVVFARGPGLETLAAAASIPYAGFLLLRYWYSRYELGDEELVVRTGLLFRNERHVPWTRIHNVGVSQNALHRLLGVLEARIETGGGEEPEALLRVIDTAAKAEIEARVLSARAEEPGSPPPAEAEPGTAGDGDVVPRLGLRDLALVGLVDSRGWVVVAALAGLAWQLEIWERFGRPQGEAVRGAAGSVVEWLRSTDGILSALAVLGLVLLVALAAFGALRILSVGWSIVTLWGFRARRQRLGMVIEHGLLTRTATALRFDRVQLLCVRETPLHRLLGRVEVRLETAADRDQEEGLSHWLTPLARRADLQELLGAVFPLPPLGDLPWRPVDPCAHRRLRNQWLLVLLGAAVLAALNLGLLAAAVVAAVLLPVALAAARGQARRLGYVVGDEVVVFRSGWLWRRTSITRRDRLQVVALTETPFDRRHRTATLKIDTAGAGGAGHPIEIPFLARETAAAIGASLAQSLPRA